MVKLRLNNDFFVLLLEKKKKGVLTQGKRCSLKGPLFYTDTRWSLACMSRWDWKSFYKLASFEIKREPMLSK